MVGPSHLQQANGNAGRTVEWVQVQAAAVRTPPSKQTHQVRSLVIVTTREIIAVGGRSMSTRRRPGHRTTQAGVSRLPCGMEARLAQRRLV